MQVIVIYFWYCDLWNHDWVYGLGTYPPSKVCGLFLTLLNLLPKHSKTASVVISLFLANTWNCDNHTRKPLSGPKRSTKGQNHFNRTIVQVNTINVISKAYCERKKGAMLIFHQNKLSLGHKPWQIGEWLIPVTPERKELLRVVSYVSWAAQSPYKAKDWICTQKYRKCKMSHLMSMTYGKNNIWVQYWRQDQRKTSTITK